VDPALHWRGPVPVPKRWPQELPYRTPAPVPLLTPGAGTGASLRPWSGINHGGAPVLRVLVSAAGFAGNPYWLAAAPELPLPSAAWSSWWRSKGCKFGSALTVVPRLVADSGPSAAPGPVPVQQWPRLRHQALPVLLTGGDRSGSPSVVPGASPVVQCFSGDQAAYPGAGQRWSVLA
jgi:hypothetical protein